MDYVRRQQLTPLEQSGKSHHCHLLPFSKAIRDRLMVNPIYKEMLEKYNLKMSQKVHHIDNLCQKLNNTKIEIPEEILNQKKFLES